MQKQNEQSNVLLAIARMITIHHLPLRFLITSRPEPHVFLNLQRTIYHRITLDSRYRPVQDVYMFLRSEFDNVYQKHRLQVPSPWPSDDVVRDLALRSRGQFIYASSSSTMKIVGR